MKKYNILGVILARYGSKGIKKKNIKIIGGHPLLAYSIYAGIKSKYITKLIVSTDSNSIAKIARSYGAEVPFLRPKVLSGDKVSSKAALKHAVLKAEQFYKKKFDYIIELPAVAPCRTSDDVDKALKILFTDKYDSVISFARVYDKHPLRMKIINKSGLVNDYDNKNPEPENQRRQDYHPCYVRNGAIYSMKRATIIKKYSRMGNSIKPLIMDELKSINIDEVSDFYLAEKIIELGLCKNKPSKILNKYQIKYENAKKENSLLISYPKKFFNEEKEKILKKYNIIFSDIKNIKKIKKDFIENVKAWLVPTNGLVKINKNNLKLLKSLKYLVSPATGMTHLDLKEIQKRKIKIIKLDNLNDTKNIFASSEFCLLLILATLRKIKRAINVVNKGNWRNQEEHLRSNEISKFNFGIFGFGRIGKNVFRHLNIMKTKINIYDPYVKIKGENLRLKKYNNLTNFLKNTDFLLISSSVKKDNYGFFNYSKLKLLKKNSIIVNISRGEIINEKDLIRLLKEKHLLGYGADIVSEEEKILNGNNVLLNYSKKHDNVLISPHVAGLTYESEKKAIGTVVKKMLRVI